ncbi:MAG: hypothetical protein ACRD3S_08460, partial [Terracidiphilus sp.]
MNLEPVYHLSYGTVEGLFFGAIFLLLLGVAALWLWWNERAGDPEDDCDGEAAARSSGNFPASIADISGHGSPRFLFLGASATEMGAPLDGLVRAHGLS